MSIGCRTHLRAERLYLVGDVVADDPHEHSTWAPTRDQAWEAVRARLLDDLAAAAPRAAAGYRAALDELEATGPQPDGWVVAAADHTYFYRPLAFSRPESLSRGETALLLALSAPG